MIFFRYSFFIITRRRINSTANYHSIPPGFHRPFILLSNLFLHHSSLFYLQPVTYRIPHPVTRNHYFTNHSPLHPSRKHSSRSFARWKVFCPRTPHQFITHHSTFILPHTCIPVFSIFPLIFPAPWPAVKALSPKGSVIFQPFLWLNSPARSAAPPHS